jgi:hypothetical protein
MKSDENVVFLFCREHLVNSGILLSFLGACTIVVGLIASFGFCGWVGVGLTPLNTNVVPFLGLAIGVVEVFVLMRALSRYVLLCYFVGFSVMCAFPPAGGHGWATATWRTSSL